MRKNWKKRFITLVKNIKKISKLGGMVVFQHLYTKESLSAKKSNSFELSCFDKQININRNYLIFVH